MEIVKHLSVLHVVAPAPFGGLESVLRMLAVGHARRGHSVQVATVLSPRRDPHPFVASLQAEGIRVIPLRIGNRDYRGERSAIRRLCRDYHPDVVHTHGFRPDVVDGGVARAEGVAIVSTCHGFVESGLRARSFLWLQRRALRRFDAVIAVSAGIASKLRASGIPQEKIHLVVNAFSAGYALSRDAARQMLNAPDHPLIGWVGRLSREKGADIALEAFALVRHPRARLLIIGEGRDQSSLYERARELGVSERILWRGVVANAGRVFPAFDAFLLSSRTEGTPIALLEAMAANVPIVATRVGGVPDVVDQSSARLIESGDAQGIAQALDEVLSKPERARARAEIAQSRLREQFGIESWLARYESVYRTVLRSDQGHSIPNSVPGVVTRA